MQQKTQQTLDLGRDASGEARSAPSQGTEASAASASLERPAVAGPSIELVVERENLKKALARVTRNKGAAGIDGMTVGELPAYLLARDPSPTARRHLPATAGAAGGDTEGVRRPLIRLWPTRYQGYAARAIWIIARSGDFGNPPHSQFGGSLLGGGQRW
jgi:hypothetical protein